jgi:hypothetical protein
LAQLSLGMAEGAGGASIKSHVFEQIYKNYLENINS